MFKISYKLISMNFSFNGMMAVALKEDYQRKGNGAQLVFADNGIGLTKDETHSFLSVIGQSSKRDDTMRNSFIGQFGIGLLSCFLVANEIKVITRSVTEEKA